MESLINIGIILTYCMVALGALTAIGFGVMKMMQNTANAKKTIYTIIGLASAFIIAYLFASDEILKSYEKYEISASESKQVGMGLIAFYLLIFGAIAAVIYAELSKVFSK